MTNFRHAPRVLETPLEDELVLLTSDMSFLVLNDSARVAWERLADPGTLQDVADAYSDVFEVDPVTASAAAKDIVGQLVDRGLLVKD